MRTIDDIIFIVSSFFFPFTWTGSDNNTEKKPFRTASSQTRLGIEVLNTTGSAAAVHQPVFPINHDQTLSPEGRELSVEKRMRIAHVNRLLSLSFSAASLFRWAVLLKTSGLRVSFSSHQSIHPYFSIDCCFHFFLANKKNEEQSKLKPKEKLEKKRLISAKLPGKNAFCFAFSFPILTSNQRKSTWIVDNSRHDINHSQMARANALSRPTPHGLKYLGFAPVDRTVANLDYFGRSDFSWPLSGILKCW